MFRFLKMGRSRPVLFIFVLIRITFQKYTLKKHKWDANQGRHDGRRGLMHWPISIYQYK